jgi:hypothetical protein
MRRHARPGSLKAVDDDQENRIEDQKKRQAEHQKTAQRPDLDPIAGK